MKEHKTLVTTEEAIRLVRKYGDLEDLETAREIYLKYMGDYFKGRDIEWHCFSAMAAIYTAGRVQGIREERQRRKAHLALIASGNE